MPEINKVFLIVLDSLGIGEMPDAAMYGDVGSNTLRSITHSRFFDAPVLTRLGLFNIDGVAFADRAVPKPLGSYARLAEKSAGKDTTTGHWEIAGVVSEKPFPTYPNGFPDSIIKEFEQKTGRKAICNKPYSGTQVLLDYGREQIETGSLIVYTSADSVFQIAAHEAYIGLDELYRCCEIARGMLVGENAVGRVIARPYIGEYPNFERTRNRHDYSLVPPPTMLNKLEDAGLESIGVGKIFDIFAGSGVTEQVKTTSNRDGMEKTIDCVKKEFRGLCFVNLVDFDMLYGHRNDIDGYAKAVSEFDAQLAELLPLLSDNDMLIITADHGCDPGTPSTDHSREYVPMLVYGKKVRQGVDLGTRGSFADIAAAVLEVFGIEKLQNSFLSDIIQE
ncbi:phosphopentomutase [Christensenellaceae bacterium OttesenSCG-928-K19]|nr:phosphopentomutase [Christensenellaceae bacterium OttesenSCG-928-K19]